MVFLQSVELYMQIIQTLSVPGIAGRRYPATQIWFLCSRSLPSVWGMVIHTCKIINNVK